MTDEQMVREELKMLRKLPMDVALARLGCLMDAAAETKYEDWFHANKNQGYMDWLCECDCSKRPSCVKEVVAVVERAGKPLAVCARCQGCA